MNDNIVLSVRDLEVNFYNNERCNRVLRGVSFQLQKGKIMCIVGESGCGKSVTANSIMGLLPDLSRIEKGEIHFFHNGRDIRIDQLKRKGKEMRQIRGDGISMIFQDPMTSLNPVLTVGEQIMEVIENHNTSLSRQEARKWAENMLERVGIPAERFGEYPHQFSGGMKQRVVIAIALACNPKLLIADEPTTALDVTIQAQVLEMIYKLKSENNTSMILITHDLGVVAQNCDYVAIIYAGEVVEYGTLREIYKDTKHPYTEGLFGSIPSLTSDVKRLQAIDGMMPDPTKLPEGCVFCERCKYAVPECSKNHPGMVTVGGTHQVRCIRYR